MKETYKLILMVIAFVLAYSFPFSGHRVQSAIMESFLMLQEYSRQHILLCLVPSFFIAGAIANFISQNSVIKYFGAGANRLLSYSVASISGSILSVCSCTVLPLFAGIYRKGAGIGPAIAFLYSGPAINVLAIILTARVLGMELGIARTVGAVVFSVIIGLGMHFIFRKEKTEGDNASFITPEDNKDGRPLWKTVLYFAVMVSIIIFANWGRDESIKAWQAVYRLKWIITISLLICLAFILVKWFRKEELKEWTISTWGFAKQIFPLLFVGVFVAGFLLGRPGHEALIPNEWVVKLVGGNSIRANLFASVSGALMYFSTLTEVPIIQGLIGSGMGKGPALALLLTGPSLSLPSILVLRSVLGTKKTLVYIILVVFFATISGLIYGTLF
ncbi:MAG: permease [Bacteroidota bacterium]|nr:permease [Elusimicrobiota bacterium]